MRDVFFQAGNFITNFMFFFVWALIIWCLIVLVASPSLYRQFIASKMKTEIESRTHTHTHSIAHKVNINMKCKYCCLIHRYKAHTTTTTAKNIYFKKKQISIKLVSPVLQFTSRNERNGVFWGRRMLLTCMLVNYFLYFLSFYSCNCDPINQSIIKFAEII